MRRMTIMMCFALTSIFSSAVGMAQSEWQMTGRLNVPRELHTATLLLSGEILCVGGWNAGFLSSAEIYDPRTGLWRDAGHLSMARYSHTATLLPTGKVLIVGGLNGTGVLASAEIYDPIKGQWTVIDSLEVPRRSHTATLLSTGEVLIVGGENDEVAGGGYLASAEIFNPDLAGGTWRDAGDLTFARGNHTATLIPETGRVLVAGGADEDHNAVLRAEIYDPFATPPEAVWTDAGELQDGRYYHSATWLPTTGQVLVFGGHNDGVVSTAEVYNPETSAWIYVESPSYQRFRHATVLLATGEVLAIGGRFSDEAVWNFEIYDPSSQEWSQSGTLLQGRWSHTAVLLPSGEVLIAGGRSDSSLSSAEIYDPSAGAWTEAVSLTVQRTRHTATLFPTNNVLVAGGWDGEALQTALVCDPVAGTCTPTDPLDQRRRDHTATLLHNGDVLVIGGVDNGNYLSLAERYVPNLDIPENGYWVNAGETDVGKANHTATLLPSGEVLVVGGVNGETQIPRTQTYDPQSGDWEDRARLNTRRELHTATLLPSGRVLVVGGQREAPSFTQSLSHAEIYDPKVDAWTEVSHLVAGRAGHTATILPSGKVLVVGGYASSNYVASAEIYDPGSDAWTAAGQLGTPRAHHTATLLPSGKVLIAGGENNAAVDSVEIYDPSSNNWTQVMNLSQGRYGHTATLLSSGDTLILGGEESGVFPDAEIYELSSPPVSRKPIIQSADGELHYGQPFDLTGLFRGDSEANGGATQDSAVNYPIFQLRSLDGTEHHTLIPDARENFWDSPTTLTISDLPPAINPGHYLLNAQVAGVSSDPVIVDMQCSLDVTPLEDRIVFVGGQATFTAESQGGRSFQWKKNNTNIAGATSSTYTTEPVDEGDDGTEYSVFVDSGCTSELSEAAEVIIFDDISPDVQVTYPSGGEYWILSNPEGEGTANTEVISWTMSDNIRICRVVVELWFSNDQGSTWSSQELAMFPDGDTESCSTTSEMPKTTSLTYTIPSEPPSGETGSQYKIGVRVTDRFGNETVSESAAPFFMTDIRQDIGTFILTHSGRMAMTPDLFTDLQTLADHPSVEGVVVDLGTVPSIQALYEAWDMEIDPSEATARANDVLFASGGIQDHIRNLLEVFPAVEHLIIVGGDQVIPMARLEDRTLILPEIAYADRLPEGSTVRQALEDNRYLSDDPLAVLHDLDPGRLDETSHLADFAIGRLVESPEEIGAAIGYYIQQDGVLDLSDRELKALVTGYDFLQDSARRIKKRWELTYSPTDVDGELISIDWDVPTVEERRDLLADALDSSPAFCSLNGHAEHDIEGVPGIDRYDIQGLPADDIAALDLTGSIISAIGCHGGLTVPYESDIAQGFLAAGAGAYLGNSGYGWGLLYGIGYGERLSVILADELASMPEQTIGDVVRRSKRRYYIESAVRPGDPYDEKTLHQPILYGFPMYEIRQIGLKVPPSSPVRVDSSKSLKSLPAHLVALEIQFEFTAEDVYRLYDSDGYETVACPEDGCYYELNGLATGEADLPIEPFFIYDSSLAGTSQHGILWTGARYLKEDGWSPVFGRLASNDDGKHTPKGTPPRIILEPNAPTPTDPTDPGNCAAQDDVVNRVVFTTGEVSQTPDDGPHQYSIHRLYEEVDLEIFYFNNLDDPNENCDRQGPSFAGGEPHEVLGTTVRWSVDVDDESEVWRVLVLWDDELSSSWRPLELSYDASIDRWVGSLPAGGRDSLTYMLQAADRRGNVSWKRDDEAPPSDVPGLIDVIEVELDESPANLSVTLTAPSEVLIGEAFSATMTVVNNSSDPAGQLSASLTLPDDMNYDFGGGNEWNCEENSPVVLCTRDALEPGETTDIYFHLIAPSVGGQGVLSACAEATEGHSAESDHCAQAILLVFGPSVTDLSIDKEDGDAVAIPGESIVYSIAVSNHGSHPVFGARVIDQFPDELIDVSWTCTATAGSSCTPAGTGDIDDSVDIASGGILIYIAEAIVASAPVTNVATVEAPSAMKDIYLANNQDSVITPGLPALFIDGFETGDCTAWVSCSGAD